MVIFQIMIGLFVAIIRTISRLELWTLLSFCTCEDGDHIVQAHITIAHFATTSAAR